MKKLFLLFFFTLTTLISFGQIICGQVLDQETRKPVDYASVFINGTFLGTTTNEDGEFELDVTSQSGRAIQISALGYRSSSLNRVIEGKNYEVLLEKTLYEILEVAVETESLVKERARCMRIFKDEFLGRSRNARNCIIMNEGDISFNLYMAVSRKSRKKYEAGRKKTHLGSCQHFFSALWLNELHKERFRVQEVDGIYALEYDEYVIEDTQGNKYFTYHQNLEIAYHYYLTTVSFRDSKVYFGRDDFFEPEAIMWYGYMSMARIADWLPYEYSPEL